MFSIELPQQALSFFFLFIYFFYTHLRFFRLCVSCKSKQERNNENKIEIIRTNFEQIRNTYYHLCLDQIFFSFSIPFLLFFNFFLFFSFSFLLFFCLFLLSNNIKERKEKETNKQKLLDEDLEINIIMSLNKIFVDLTIVLCV